MTEVKKQLSKNTVIVHEGDQIILPVINGKPMSMAEAIDWLNRRTKEDESQMAVHNVIPCSPLDGAVAFQKAIAKKYGWSQAVPTPGFFGDTPPVMIGVSTGPNEVTQVPWGRINVPGIDGFLTTGMDARTGIPTFIIGGQVKKKHADLVKELVDMTKEILHTGSLYRGKPIKVSFDWLREGNNFDPILHAPRFLDLKGVKDDDLIFGESVMSALNVGLFTPIEYPEACREVGIPLKRGVLLYGPYGTGKTMTAFVSALKAEKSGWTFIYLDDVRDLKWGLEMAAQYAPAVIFAEDIDRAIYGERSVSMDEVLNTLDGVDTKGVEVITVLTTNHIEKINPAMLRPGRLDTLVEVTPPDAKAAAKLVQLYARDLLEKKAQIGKISEALAGKIPAVIREVVERAKIAAVSREKSAFIKGKVSEADLLTAIEAMENHISMLTVKKTANDNAEQKVFIPVPMQAAGMMLDHLDASGL